MSRPTRVLAWKEWREQRPVIISGLAAVAVLPVLVQVGAVATGRSIDRGVLLDSIYLVTALLVWPVFTAAVGATTFANERAEGTLGFILSRPVSRSRLWFTKVLVGWLSVLGIIVGSLLIARIIQGVIRVPESRGHLDVGSVGALTALALPVLLLVFACSVLCSTFLSRSLTAAAAGFALSPLILAGIASVWWRLDLRLSLNPVLLIALVCAAGFLILGASFWFFSRGESRVGKAGVAKAAMISLAAVAAMGAIAVAWIQAQARLSPSTAILSDLAIDPAGDTVALTAAHRDGGSPRIWFLRPDSGGFEQVTGRLTARPVFSPDGQWMAYLSMRGLLGLRSDRVALRVMKLDGTSDRILEEDVPRILFDAGGSLDLTFSPDSSRLAMTAADTLIVASMSQTPIMRRSLAEVSLSGMHVIGWTSGGDEVLLMKHAPRESVEATVIAAFNPFTGRFRVVYESPLSHRQLFWRAPRSGIRKLPVGLLTADGQPAGDLLVDVIDGTESPLEPTQGRIRPVMDLSADGMLLGYLSGDEIHVRDVESGTDSMLVSIPDGPVQIVLSPAGDRVLVGTRKSREEESVSVLIVDSSGSVTPVARDWWPLAWSGTRRVILSGLSNERFALAVVDLDTGDIRQFYP